MIKFIYNIELARCKHVMFKLSEYDIDKLVSVCILSCFFREEHQSDSFKAWSGATEIWWGRCPHSRTCSPSLWQNDTQGRARKKARM